MAVGRKWLLVGGGAFLSLVAVALVLLMTGSDEADRPSVAEIEAMAGKLEQEPVESGSAHCVRLWNSPANAYPRQRVANLGDGLYVSVGSSDVYPDKCLITAAAPELDLAAQFLEGGSGTNAGGSPYSPAGSGSARTLPASVTNWNAASDRRGYILLGD